MRLRMKPAISAHRFTALALSAVLAVIAAGGTSAGIQGSGFRMAAVGPVEAGDGFVVNGVAYDVSHAQVIIDGVPSDPSALREGHVVSVQSSVSARGAVAIADEITLVSNVRGTVTEVDANARTALVLGQIVHLPDSDAGAVIAPGAQVAVSGFSNAAGELVATRLDAEPSGAESQVRGVVEALDSTMRSFRINGLAVDYTSAAVVGSLTPGTIVTARGSATDAGFALLATRVDVAPAVGAPNEKGDITGLVTRFASQGDFDVNGLRVVADGRTKYHLKQGDVLGLDTEVHVKGRFDTTGALVARQIRVRTGQ